MSGDEFGDHYVILKLDSGDWVAKTSGGHLLDDPRRGVHVDHAAVAGSPVMALFLLEAKLGGKS